MSVFNWTKENLTTVGNGAALTVSGPVSADFLPWSAHAAVGDTCHYAIKDNLNRESGTMRYDSATGMTKLRIFEKLEGGVLTANPAVTAGITLSGSAQISSDMPAQMYGGTAASAGSSAYGGQVGKRFGSAAPLQGAASTMLQISDNMYFAPYYLAQGISLAALAILVTTPVAASNIKLALYSRLADGSPGALIASTGNITTTAAALARGVITQSNINITPGWYWVAIHTSHAITVQTTDGNVLSPNGSGLNDPRLQLSRLTAALSFSSGLPDPAPTGAAGNSTLSNNAGVLQIVLEAA